MQANITKNQKVEESVSFFEKIFGSKTKLKSSLTVKCIDGKQHFLLLIPLTTSVVEFFEDLASTLENLTTDVVKYHSYMTAVPIENNRGYKITVVINPDTNIELANTKIFGVLDNVLRSFQ